MTHLYLLDHTVTLHTINLDLIIDLLYLIIKSFDTINLDFIIDLLYLIIKPFDNQTERWNPVSMIWLSILQSSHLTLSFDNQW